MNEEFVEIVDWCKDLLERETANADDIKLARLQSLFDNALQFEYLFWEMAWNMEVPV